MFPYCVSPVFDPNSCHLCPRHWTVSLSNLSRADHHSSWRSAGTATLLPCQPAAGSYGQAEEGGHTKVFTASESGGKLRICNFFAFFILLLFSLGVVVLWDLRLCFLYPVYRGWSHYHHCQHWGPHCHTVLNSNQEDVRNTHLQGQWMHGKSRFEIVISESQN